MRLHTARIVGIAMISLCAHTAAVAQQQKGSQRGKPLDFGRMEYEAKCASCHGPVGKGDGPTKPYLTRSPADLSVLAKANNGIMPVARMYDVIVGEKEVPVHGTREMPVWGTAYKIEAGEFYVDVPYDPEAYVRSRVLALIEYINRLQAK